MTAADQPTTAEPSDTDAIRIGKIALDARDELLPHLDVEKGLLYERQRRLRAHVGRAVLAALAPQPAANTEQGALYCGVHGDLLAERRSARCAEAPAGHEYTRPPVADTCDGSGRCTASLHVHGCFADLDGRCDDPDDHAASQPATNTERDEQLREARTDAAYLRRRPGGALAMGLGARGGPHIVALDDEVARLENVVTAEQGRTRDTGRLTDHTPTQS